MLHVASVRFFVLRPPLLVFLLLHRSRRPPPLAYQRRCWRLVRLLLARLRRSNRPPPRWFHQNHLNHHQVADASDPVEARRLPPHQIDIFRSRTNLNQAGETSLRIVDGRPGMRRDGREGVAGEVRGGERAECASARTHTRPSSESETGFSGVQRLDLG